MSVTYVNAKLPKAGLGNKLFVWANALVFSRLNNLPLVVTNWVHPSWGAFIRGGGLRLYWNYFNKVNEVSFFDRKFKVGKNEIVAEPLLGKLKEIPNKTVFQFSNLPPWSDYFGQLKPYRDAIKFSLLNSLTWSRQKEVYRLPKPNICIDIRLSDFQKLKPGVSFSSVGNTRTPVNYFVELIQNIRKFKGVDLPVTIITDGSNKEFKEILTLPNVLINRNQTAIGKIFLMSQSKILITSAGSTFDYWGGFLGENVLLIHPDHVHCTVRPGSINQDFFEGPAVGPAENWPDLLRKNILDI